MIRLAFLGPVLLLAACSGMPADPDAIDANAARIAPKVATGCVAKGAVQMGNNIVAPFVPGGALVAMGLNAGWDALCADPEGVGRAIGTVEEEALRLRD